LGTCSALSVGRVPRSLTLGWVPEGVYVSGLQATPTTWHMSALQDMGCISVSVPSVCCISHSTGTHVPTCAGAPVYTHQADSGRTQEAKYSNLCKQRKHGNRTQTELAHRYGQGKCRKVQGMRARWTRTGMAHACNEHVRARKGLCQRRLCRRQCSRHFASMRAVQVYGHGQVWCCHSASWCI